jgi:hypothetical protein
MINTIFMNLASSDFAGIFTILFVIAIVVAVIIAVFSLIFTIVKVIKFTSSMKKERAAAKEAAGVSSKKAGSDASEDGAAVFALSFKDGRAVVMSKNKNPLARDVVMLMNSLFTRDGSWRIRLADADYDAKNHKILGTVVNCLGEKGAKVLFDISFFDGKAVNAFKLGIKKKGYDAYLRVGKDSKGVGLCSLHQQGII